MIISRIPIVRRLFFIIPILTIGFWFVAQKGCEMTPDASPTRAFGEEAPHPSKPKSRSLEKASALLRQAADMVDKDNPLAVKLIRQAIAILKQEVMPGIDIPEYDRISMRSALELHEPFGENPPRAYAAPQIFRYKDSELIPRSMTRNVEGPGVLCPSWTNDHHQQYSGGYVMNRNGQKAFPQAPPRLTCYGCRKAIDLEHEDTLVEMIGSRWLQDVDIIRWHQDCFNHYLDEGEET